MSGPITVSPKNLGDLYGAADISHSPVVMRLVPGVSLVLMGSIMVFHDPTGTLPPDQGGTGVVDDRLRVIQRPEEVPNIFGILLEDVDTGPQGFTEEVNASVDRKGSFKADQLHVGAQSTVTVPECAARLRELGIFLEGVRGTLAPTP